MFATPVPLSLALAVSVLVAVAAWKWNSLTARGALAAALVGAVALRVSLGVGMLLIFWFLLAAAVSKFGSRTKRERMRGVVEKGSRRDATQVLANGGVYGLLVTLLLIVQHFGATEGVTPGAAQWALAAALGAAGSLAAAGADTWATEIGVWVGGMPWSVRTYRRVPPGTSGAISIAGCVAMSGAAALMAVLAIVFNVVPPEGQYFRAVFLGGIAGAMVDTIIGATIQERRWCPNCLQETEQRGHECGTRTVVNGGIGAFTNDAVNLLCALTGALVAALPVLF